MSRSTRRASSSWSSTRSVPRVRVHVPTDASSYAHDLLTLRQRVHTVQSVYPRALTARTRFVFDRRLPTLPLTKPRAARLPRLLSSSVSLKGLFASPQLRFCVRRAQRRQVMFAHGVAGSRGLRRYRRSYYSQFSCGGR